MIAVLCTFKLWGNSIQIVEQPFQVNKIQKAKVLAVKTLRNFILLGESEHKITEFIFCDSEGTQ